MSPDPAGGLVALCSGVAHPSGEASVLTNRHRGQEQLGLAMGWPRPPCSSLSIVRLPPSLFRLLQPQV